MTIKTYYYDSTVDNFIKERFLTSGDCGWKVQDVFVTRYRYIFFTPDLCYLCYTYTWCICIPVYHRHTLYLYWYKRPIIKDEQESIQMTFQVSFKICLMKCYLLNHLDCNFLPHYFFFTWCALHGFWVKRIRLVGKCPQVFCQRKLWMH